MPTTHSEASQIAQISLKYMTAEKLSRLYTELDEEVGRYTENDSLKKSLAMMRLLMSQERDTLPENASPSKFLWLGFCGLWAVHMALVAGIGLSFFVLPFLAPWYIALPLCTFIFFFSTANVKCPLTDLENALRRRLGLRVIRGFVGHYIKRPVYQSLTKVGAMRPRTTGA